MSNPITNQIELEEKDEGLFFSTCREAVEAINEGGGSRIQYMDFYRNLRDGGVPGAYQSGRYWRIPVDGLREIGYNPKTDNAIRHAEEVVEGGYARRSSARPIHQAKAPSEAPEPIEIVDFGKGRREEITLELLALLERENQALKEELRVEKEKLETSEKHLRDLRSILDYATSPSQERPE